MKLSRRAFVHVLGIGGAGALSGTLVTARGREDLVGLGRVLGRPDPSDWVPGLEDAKAVRLSSNENPNGPGPRALDAIHAALGDAHRYPFAYESSVTAAVARKLGVGEDQVMAGCGSGEILRMCALAFTSPARPLVAGLPTFEDPGATAKVIGAPVRSVRVDAELKLDLAAMLAAVNGAGLVFLCNPNNPTSTVHPDSVVRDFIRRVHRVSPETVILVDEAYHEYVDEPGYRTAIPIALEEPRVIVCRTFSKIYGMAGLRLGYAVARKETLDRLAPYQLSNNVNALVAAAGVATLDDDERVVREQRLNREARDFTRKAFADMGYPSVESHTNFVMVPIRRDAKAFQDECRSHGILVGRLFPPLVDHARISIGTMDEMRQAVDVFRRVLGVSTMSRG